MIHPDGITVIVHFICLRLKTHDQVMAQKNAYLYAVHGVQSDVDNATSFFLEHKDE